MNLEQMIDELNEYVGDSLIIVKYVKWELHSYESKSAFSLRKGKAVEAETFSGVIKKAYKMMLENKLWDVNKPR